MAASNRANVAPGRTPPFILVGLVVVLCFLAYNYWSLSSRNAELLSELEKGQLEVRSKVVRIEEVGKELEVLQEELARNKKGLEDATSKFQERETELGKVRTDFANLQGEADKCQQSLVECNGNAATAKEEVEKLRVEKEDIERALGEEREKVKTCNMQECLAPVRQVLTIASKLVGSEQMAKALNNNELDAAQLMEGIDIPAPAQPQQQGNPPQPQGNPPQQQGNPPQQQGNPPQQQENPQQQGNPPQAANVQKS